VLPLVEASSPTLFRVYWDIRRRRKTRRSLRRIFVQARTLIVFSAACFSFFVRYQRKMACDDRSTSSSNGDSSDDDSFIDLYAHVEQQGRRAERKNSQNLSSDDEDDTPPFKSPISNRRRSSTASAKDQPRGLLGSFLETNQRTTRSKPGSRSICSAPAVVRKMSSDASVASRQTVSGSMRQKGREARPEESPNRSTPGSQRSSFLKTQSSRFTSGSQRSSFSRTQSSRFGRSNSGPSSSSGLAAPRRTQSTSNSLQPSSRDRKSAYGKSVGSSSLSRNKKRPAVTKSPDGGETVMEAKLREIRSEQEALRKKSEDIKRKVSKERQTSSRSPRRRSTTDVPQRPHRLSDTFVGSSTTLNSDARRRLVADPPKSTSPHRRMAGNS
jgi:hypothetical protein